VRTAEWTESTRVLDRVTAIFDAFGEADEGLGVSELARRANLPKSTVSRIAADLVSQRFLDREDDRLYLGVRLFELGQTVQEPRRLRRIALPMMTELRNLTGATVQLAVPEGPDVVIVAVVRGRPGQTPLPRVGSRLPAHATALGKALWAFRAGGPDLAVARGRLTPHTILEPGPLNRELGEVRRTGFAGEREECVIGRVGLAGPVLDPAGIAVAAIGLAASVGDLDVDRLAPAVRTTARRLAHGLSAARDS
jgi:IclR family transcriptional regulator, acetate operon repressor